MVDVLLATYNGEGYISELLDSLVCQTYQDFRLIVRDDNSIDRTIDIVKSYQNQLKIEIVHDGDTAGGAKNNFFQLLKYASSDFVFFADQDDVWLPNKIEISLHEIWRYEQSIPLLVHTDLEVVDNTLHQLNPSLMHLQKLNPAYCTLNRLIAQNNVTGCTMLINKALVEQFRNADDSIMHDWWLALIAAAFGKVIFLPLATVKYRQHTQNEVGAKDVKSAEYFKSKINNTQGIHESIKMTYKQAQAFLKTFRDGLDNQQAEMLNAFCALEQYGKCKRFLTLNRYQLFKSGLYRKIGQIIYG
ncbi:MAG: glycosyltransferase family 2 protein [Christensenellaceae bacterium]